MNLCVLFEDIHRQKEGMLCFKQPKLHAQLHTCVSNSNQSVAGLTDLTCQFITIYKISFILSQTNKKKLPTLFTVPKCIPLFEISCTFSYTKYIFNENAILKDI